MRTSQAGQGDFTIKLLNYIAMPLAVSPLYPTPLYIVLTQLKIYKSALYHTGLTQLILSALLEPAPPSQPSVLCPSARSHLHTTHHCAVVIYTAALTLLPAPTQYSAVTQTVLISPARVIY